MSPWDGASRWINTLLLAVVGFIGFDTLFRLLEANERNVIVGFTRTVATVLLNPFQGMFDDQDYLLTSLIAILGYALVAGIGLAVIRSVQASRRRARLRQDPTLDAWGVPPPARGAWNRPQRTGSPDPGAPTPEHLMETWGAVPPEPQALPQPPDATEDTWPGAREPTRQAPLRAEQVPEWREPDGQRTDPAPPDGDATEERDPVSGLGTTREANDGQRAGPSHRGRS